MNNPGSSRALSTYDDTRIAVVFLLDQPVRVLRGAARYIRDWEQGNVLRIVLDQEAEESESAIVIAEDEWRGELRPDLQHGCDYLLSIPSTGPTSADADRSGL